MDYLHFPAKTNDYWKLQTYGGLPVKDMKSILQQRGYDSGSIKDKEDLKLCLQRSDIGLLSYTTLTNNQLRDVIHARRIETNDLAGKKGNRSELIDILDHADNNRKFDKFTELPPELRNRVYEYYFAAFEAPLHAPKQPPIALVNSLLRAETLPLFYATCVFDFILVMNRGPRRGNWLQMPAETHMWLSSTNAENITDIKHLRIKVYRQQPKESANFGDPIFCFYFDQFQAGEDVQLRLWAPAGMLSTSETLRNVQTNMNKMTEEIASRAGGWKLVKEYFFAIRRAIELSSQR